MKNGRWLVVVGLAAAAAAAPAAAQEQGIYLGGSGGYSQYREVCDTQQALLVPCDDNHTTWRAFTGYQFNRWFALEFGYADLGNAEGVGPGTSFTYKVRDAFDLSAVLLLPVADSLSVLARAGAFQARATLDVNTAGTTTHAASSGGGWIIGLGAEYRLGPIGVRAEWQHYKNVGGPATGEDNIDVLSAGVLWRF